MLKIVLVFFKKVLDWDVVQTIKDIWNLRRSGRYLLTDKKIWDKVFFKKGI
jgi:hypothetical protein